MTQHRADPAGPRRRTRRRPIALAAVALATAAACGGDDDADQGAALATEGTQAAGPGGVRTVEVAMVDNEFVPAEVEVAPGEEVRFVFANEGAVTHDAVIGDEAAQAEHEEEMRAADGAMDGMGHGAEGEEGAVTVDPGGAGELTHTFAAGDELLIGCHEPGHYDAGMRLRVSVTEA